MEWPALGFAGGRPQPPNQPQNQAGPGPGFWGQQGVASSREKKDGWRSPAESKAPPHALPRTSDRKHQPKTPVPVAHTTQPVPGAALPGGKADVGGQRNAQNRV